MSRKNGSDQGQLGKESFARKVEVVKKVEPKAEQKKSIAAGEGSRQVDVPQDQHPAIITLQSSSSSERSERVVKSFRFNRAPTG